MRISAAAAVVLAIAAGGCAGEDATVPTVPTGERLLAASPPSRRSNPGAALERFVAAARARDRTVMWELLSRRSRARAGRTPNRFGARYADSLERSAGMVGGPGSELFLAVRIDARWAVAAVEKVRGGQPPRLRRGAGAGGRPLAGRGR